LGAADDACSRATLRGVSDSRLDRLSVWSLPWLFIGIIGIGFLFTFYDFFDINVSFIQTCVAIVPNCTPETAAQHLGLPVLLNLVGYVIGTLALSPLADRAVRRDLLLVTMVISGVGSALTALVGSYGWFVAARTITGIGIGADWSTRTSTRWRREKNALVIRR
jgi:MFS transporter, putative metabolite:H+ symporter